MWFEILNTICWVILFVSVYIILNPEVKILKNIQPSPYKKIQKNDRHNILSILSYERSIEKSHLFQCPNFHIAVFNLNGSLNVGNIMRSGCIFGVQTFHIIGKKLYDSRSCVGANKYTNIKLLNDIILDLPDKAVKPKVNINKFRSYIIKNNFNPIFVEQGGKDLTEFNFNETYYENPLFIFGNETYGIDMEVIKSCKDIKGFAFISIPQIGLINSMNVSTSASIVIWEFYKQKLKKTNPKYKINLH